MAERGSQPLEKDQYEKFVQLIVAGKKKREAYKTAFGVIKDDCASAAGSRVFHRPEVQERYIYLMKQAGKELKRREKEAAKQHHAKVTKGEVPDDEKVKDAVAVTGERAEILKKWADIARADLTDYFSVATSSKNDNGTVELEIKDLKDLPPELRIAIKEIRLDKYGRPQLILYDRMAALEKLSAFYKLIGEDKDDDVTRVDLSGVPGGYDV